ncbi:MAG: dTDP-4-dehydrorhamnose 3,5-epimerase [Lewinellaceae bacterium]|nr:dTDP-4-dehydrorhamnose 3,5-epimerase [Lewinella sp.]MCB9279575.1 dTDP-4-dehydrorhamnose 3,5-epimerase [Lewinellaceae bacterium]
MPFTPTPIGGLMIYDPVVFPDDRGYFFESFNRLRFGEGGVYTDFVQDNEAKSGYGVLRGLHYQAPPFAQAKLVRVIEGEVLDVVVDIREHSPTYGQWYGVRLSGDNKRQLFIPRGFAHGYVVLSETAIFAYKCDNYYSKAHEGGLSYNDPALGIDWEIDPAGIILSEKDTSWPPFGRHRK